MKAIVALVLVACFAVAVATTEDQDLTKDTVEYVTPEFIQKNEWGIEPPPGFQAQTNDNEEDSGADVLDTAQEAAEEAVQCFAPSTPIEMADGTTKHISQIRVGDEVRGGSVVGVMQFAAQNTPLFVYNGVVTSGIHKVLENGKFVAIAESTQAVALPDIRIPVLFDLDTTSHRIYALGNTFADFSEVDALPEVETLELNALNRQ